MSQALTVPLQRVEPVDFDELYDATSDQAFRVLGSMGVRDAELDDALQDVFVVAHRRLPTFRGESSLSTWVTGIAVRVAHDYRRRYQRKPSEPLEETEVEAPHSSPDASAMRSEGLRAVQAFLAQLSPTLLEVFVLAELEQQTAPEIAQSLAVPVNTVYSRLRLARERFEAFVEQLNGVTS